MLRRAARAVAAAARRAARGGESAAAAAAAGAPRLPEAAQARRAGGARGMATAQQMQGMKKYKPTTPGFRGRQITSREGLWKGAPYKKLTRGMRKTGGRNHKGRCAYHQRGTRVALGGAETGRNGCLCVRRGRLRAPVRAPRRRDRPKLRCKCCLAAARVSAPRRGTAAERHGVLAVRSRRRWLRSLRR